MGNWLTVEQGKRLLRESAPEGLPGKRNHTMLALLIGCGNRRGELLSLTVESGQLREEHWVIADLSGKAGHISPHLDTTAPRHGFGRSDRIHPVTHMKRERFQSGSRFPVGSGNILHPQCRSPHTHF